MINNNNYQQKNQTTGQGATQFTQTVMVTATANSMGTVVGLKRDKERRIIYYNAQKGTTIVTIAFNDKDGAKSTNFVDFAVSRKIGAFLKQEGLDLLTAKGTFLKPTFSISNNGLPHLTDVQIWYKDPQTGQGVITEPILQTARKNGRDVQMSDYQPQAPAQSQAPVQPAYQAPVQNAYQAPAQPNYQGYQAPVQQAQPAYQQPQAPAQNTVVYPQTQQFQGVMTPSAMDVSDEDLPF